jgi:hypothetical protein
MTLTKRTFEPSLVSRSVKITYTVQIDDYQYVVDEYYNGNNELVMDAVSVDGMPIGSESRAIRNKLTNFIKDYRIFN